METHLLNRLSSTTWHAYEALGLVYLSLCSTTTRVKEAPGRHMVSLKSHAFRLPMKGEPTSPKPDPGRSCDLSGHRWSETSGWDWE